MKWFEGLRRIIVLDDPSDYDKLRAEEKHYANFIGYRMKYNLKFSNNVGVIKSRYGPSGVVPIRKALMLASEKIYPWELFTADEIVKYRLKK
jgi:hypothetical protein